MSTHVSVDLPDDSYQQISHLAQLSNQSIASILSSLINNVFSALNRKLNAPDIEVAVRNEQTKPQVVLTLPDATSNFLDGLYQAGSQTATPELIMIQLPQDKDISKLLSSTIVANLSEFRSKVEAEHLVSKLSDSELLALIEAKGQLAGGNPLQQSLFAMPLVDLLRSYQDTGNRIMAAKQEAYRRGLGKYPEMGLF